MNGLRLLSALRTLPPPSGPMNVPSSRPPPLDPARLRRQFLLFEAIAVQMEDGLIMTLGGYGWDPTFTRCQEIPADRTPHPLRDPREAEPTPNPLLRRLQGRRRNPYLDLPRSISVGGPKCGYPFGRSERPAERGHLGVFLEFWKRGLPAYDKREGIG